MGSSRATPSTGELMDRSCSLPSPAIPPLQASAPSPGHNSHTSKQISGQEPDTDSPAGSPTSPPAQPQFSGDSVLIACFADLLQRELEKATTKSASELKQDFQELRHCLDSIESKFDDIHPSTEWFKILT